MIDSAHTHRETGLRFSVEAGDKNVVVTFPPDVERDGDDCGYVVVSLEVLRALADFLYTLPEPPAKSYLAMTHASRNIEDSDIPF